jgi:hypothetical protein
MYALLLTGLLVGPHAVADGDRWFGSDKALHVGVTVFLAGAGYAGSARVLKDCWARALTGAGIAIAAGAAKESIDLATHSDPSLRDFGDVVGATTSAVIAWGLDAWVISPREAPPAEISKARLAGSFRMCTAPEHRLGVRALHDVPSPGGGWRPLPEPFITKDGAPTPARPERGGCTESAVAPAATAIPGAPP